MPKRPPKAWFQRCVHGVNAHGSASDPNAVCGSVWARKSAGEKRATMRKNEVREPARRKPKMSSGYAYELDAPLLNKRNPEFWGVAVDDAWDTVMYTPNGKERAVGERKIDGARCVVFKCSDGFYRAQMTQSTRV